MTADGDRGGARKGTGALIGTSLLFGGLAALGFVVVQLLTGNTDYAGIVIGFAVIVLVLSSFTFVLQKARSRTRD